jgi:hypothetical protein
MYIPDALLYLSIAIGIAAVMLSHDKVDLR